MHGEGRVEGLERAFVGAALRTVACVPMTPILPLRVSSAAVRAPGTITSCSGTANSARKASRASAEEVLQATTILPTPWPSRKRQLSREKRVTDSRDLLPYGTRAVSPK